MIPSKKTSPRHEELACFEDRQTDRRKQCFDVTSTETLFHAPKLEGRLSYLVMTDEWITCGLVVQKGAMEQK